jgi:hypothetical protein
MDTTVTSLGETVSPGMSPEDSMLWLDLGHVIALAKSWAFATYAEEHKRNILKVCDRLETELKKRIPA